MKLGIGAGFKNETHIMIEWIEHYLFHGVDNIYLINDHSTDNIDEIKNLYNNDKIKFYDSDVDSGPYNRQIDIYNKYLTEIKNYDWFGILDLDEFLYSPEHINLKDALQQVPNHINQIHINWVTFGSNDHVSQPISVVEGFRKRISDIGNVNFLSHKSLFRPHYLNNIDIHTHHVEGASENFSFIQNNNNPLFLLNHYVIQSQNFFKAVKSQRGDVNKIVSTQFRDMNYFNKYNLNNVIDDCLYLQNKECISSNIDNIRNFHVTHVKF
jgi:hypothetical protein